MALLERYFDIELKIMTKYNVDKMNHPKFKKKPQFKTAYQNLLKLKSNEGTKKVVLDTYYHKYVVQRNLEESIMYMASLRKASDDPESNPDYGQLLDREVANLKKCQENFKKSKEFIFKGTKATDKVVGTREKLEDEGKPSKADPRKSRNLKGGDLKTLSKDKMSMKSGEEEEKGMNDMDDALEKSPDEKVAKKTSTTEKKAAPAKSPAKSTSSPAKAGKGKAKGKKKKGDTFDRTIPDNKPKPHFMYIPDRQTMQRFVNRALGLLKAAEKELQGGERPDYPIYEEVRPWIRVDHIPNADIKTLIAEPEPAEMEAKTLEEDQD